MAKSMMQTAPFGATQGAPFGATKGARFGATKGARFGAGTDTPLGAVTIARAVRSAERLAEAVSVWRARQRTVRALSRLNARQLDDIGLTEADVASLGVAPRV